MPFIHDDVLLESPAARRLYHEHAAPQPILDFHCHLSPADIAANRIFDDLAELWLEGDHYKWRAMRANGVDERYCSGDATPEEKYLAFAATLPRCLRNPLYHWAHLELARVFGITELLDPDSAPAIRERANRILAERHLSVRDLLEQFKVRALCTTDDPADALDAHAAIAASPCPARVFPTFRPDRALAVDQPAALAAWVKKLEAAANLTVDSFQSFLDALAARHQAFHAIGARLSDHGLPHAYGEACTDRAAAGIFGRALAGETASAAEHARFAAFLMRFFARLDAEKGWTMQLHLGARRNVNSRAFAALGPDTGFDSVGDWPQAAQLGAFLDSLDREQILPQTIVYNLNPADSYPIATMLGNFQEGTELRPCRMQWGAAWWFLDHRHGIEEHLNILSNVGLLARFVGMLTDSRSFLSFPRHEYFRRVLCNLLGREMESGLLPADDALIGALVRDLSFGNAARTLGLELAPAP